MNVFDSVQQDRPKTVYLYATSKCNSRCSYCVFRSQNQKLHRQDLSVELIDVVFGKSEMLKGAGVVVQGGEFTMHPEAILIMNVLKKQGHKLTLLTNMVEPRLVEPLLGYCDKVTISYDGPNHDHSRGIPGNRASILDFIAKKRPFEVDLQMTLGPWNLDVAAVSEFITTCVKAGVGCRFNVAFPSGLLGNAKYSHDIKRLEEIAEMVEEIAKERLSAQYLRTVAASLDNPLWRPECVSTSMYPTIMADGSVLICQGLSPRLAKVGDIRNEPFDKIWAESAQLRRALRRCTECLLSCQLFGDLKFQHAVAEGGAK